MPYKRAIGEKWALPKGRGGSKTEEDSFAEYEWLVGGLTKLRWTVVLYLVLNGFSKPHVLQLVCVSHVISDNNVCDI